MTRRLFFGIAGVMGVALGLAVQAGVTVEAQQGAAAQAELFEGKVRPILAASCLSCHSSSAAGGLRLDSREGLLKGGEAGPAIVVGEPEKSLLLSAVRHTGELKMPMGGERLTDAEIADLAAWIEAGAVWPETQAGAKPESVLSDHFETHIRPVLAQQCFACHTSTKSGGLRLDSKEGLLAGGKSGPALVPGDPGKSLLLTAIRHSGSLRMPKGATRLTDDQIAQFSTWIEDGAHWTVEKSLA
jgi:mono/diheme cytochrome c family protein